MTTDELHDLYQDGDITYWDYLFCYYILVGESVAYALNVANTHKPGETITDRGYEVAKQILTQLGRTGEIKDIPAAYSWQVIAEASSANGLSKTKPKVDTILGGTEGRVVIKVPWPTAYPADLWGAEKFGKYMAPKGANVTDVYAHDGSHIYIDFVMKEGVAGSASGGYGSFEPVSWSVVALIGAIAIALIAVGVVIISVAVLVYGPKVVKEIGKAGTNWLMWGAIGAVGVAAIMVLGEKRKAAS